MTIQVFSKPACYQCVGVKRYLDRAGLPYEMRDVSTDPEALATVQALGYDAVPVVVQGDNHFYGLRVDRINQLTSE